MEIDYQGLNWQIKVWFLLLLVLTLVAMETGSSSLNDTSELSTEPSPLHHKDRWKETTNDPDGPQGEELTPSSQSEINVVPETPYLGMGEEEYAYWSESGLEDIDCETFSSLPPPPPWDDLRPPPLPPFLKEVGLLFQESWRRRALILTYPDVGLEELKGLQDEMENIPEEGQCPLCDWSQGNNDTLDVLIWRPTTESESEQETSSTMIWALVGVALISASVGAIFMGLLLKCRRKDVITICSKTSSSESNPTLRDGATVSEHQRNKMAALKMSLKNYQGNSQQSPLDPFGTGNAQNTYSESLYINGDTPSTLYAEINNPTNAETSVLTNLYPAGHLSERPEPVVSSSGLTVCYNKLPKAPNKEGTYSNSAYVVSEVSSEPNESSGGSTSTPSSAYYSDVSTSVEIHSSKRKKKKRKTDERLPNNIRFAQSIKIGGFPPSIVPSQLTCHKGSREQPTPQVLAPRRFPCKNNLDKNILGVNARENNPPHIMASIATNPSSSNLLQAQAPMPESQVLNSVSCCPHAHVNTQAQAQLESITLCPLCHSVYSDELILMTNNEVPSQRPLPPLPSRQMQGPQRRSGDDKNPLEKTLSAVPSEYI